MLAAIVIAGVAALALTYPRDNPTGRRRLPWLLLLALPWVIGIVAGPMGLVEDLPDRKAFLLTLQNVLIGLSIGLPLALLLPLAGARRITAVAGVINLVIMVAVAGANQLIIEPGS
jgi:hypothetical protein